MYVRPAKPEDIERMIEVYAMAKRYMDASGNETQWKPGYPGRAVIEEDIEKGWAYVCIENEVVYGIFEFFMGGDPTYQVIDGAWQNDRPYATVHRVAGSGEVRGVFEAMINYVKDRCDNVRMDTHENNHTMQHLFEKHGFKKCGTIWLADGRPRWAYHYVNSKKA